MDTEETRGSRVESSPRDHRLDVESDSNHISMGESKTILSAILRLGT